MRQLIPGVLARGSSSLWGSRARTMVSSSIQPKPKVQFILLEPAQAQDGLPIGKGASAEQYRNPSEEYKKVYDLHEKIFQPLVTRGRAANPNETHQLWKQHGATYTAYVSKKLVPLLTQSLESLGNKAIENKDAYYKQHNNTPPENGNTIIQLITPENSFYSSVAIPEEIFWNQIVKYIDDTSKSWSPQLHADLSSFPVLVMDREQSAFSEIFREQGLFGGLDPEYSHYPIVLNVSLHHAPGYPLIWTVKHAPDRSDSFYELAGGPTPEHHVANKFNREGGAYKYVSPRNARISKTPAGTPFCASFGICRDSIASAVSIPATAVARLIAMTEDPNLILNLAGFTVVSSDTADRLDPSALGQERRIQITSIPFGLLAHSDSKLNAQVATLDDDHSPEVIIRELDSVRVPINMEDSIYLRGHSLACFPTQEMQHMLQEFRQTAETVAALNEQEKADLLGIPPTMSPR